MFVSLFLCFLYTTSAKTKLKTGIKLSVGEKEELPFCGSYIRRLGSNQEPQRFYEFALETSITSSRLQTQRVFVSDEVGIKCKRIANEPKTCTSCFRFHSFRDLEQHKF